MGFDSVDSNRLSHQAVPLDLNKTGTGSGWSIDASRDLYKVGAWGSGFFDINEKAT